MRRSGNEASHCLRALGAMPQRLRPKRQRTRNAFGRSGRVRTFGSVSWSASNARRLLLGATGGGRTLRGKAGRMRKRPRTPKHRSQWYRTKPSGEVPETALRHRLHGVIHPRMDIIEGSIPVAGQRTRRPRSTGPMEGRGGDPGRRLWMQGSLRHWFRSAPCAGTAAAKTPVPGRERRRSHPRLSKPAPSGAGGGNRNLRRP
jgi:hypothetical protein